MTGTILLPTLSPGRPPLSWLAASLLSGSIVDSQSMRSPDTSVQLVIRRGYRISTARAAASESALRRWVSVVQGFFLSLRRRSARYTSSCRDAATGATTTATSTKNVVVTWRSQNLRSNSARRRGLIGLVPRAASMLAIRDVFASAADHVIPCENSTRRKCSGAPQNTGRKRFSAYCIQSG